MIDKRLSNGSFVVSAMRHPEGFSSPKVLLNDQLKRLMVRYEQSDPVFYVSFQDGLKIVDYGIRYEKPEEEVMQ